jgi:hypothetical protein
MVPMTVMMPVAGQVVAWVDELHAAGAVDPATGAVSAPVRKAIAALHATLAAGDAARMARLEDAFDAFAKATAVINSGAGLVAGP